MRTIQLTVILLLFSLSGFSQSQETLLTIGNKKISGDEFFYIYKKNNSDNINTETIDEYLKLFTNFKLKVAEAENLKMDTSKTFVKELSGYRMQLAKPYLAENVKWDELIKEAGERSKKEVKVDVIFTKLGKNASPEDTLKAYNKQLAIRERLIKGENYDSVAVQSSDDRNVKNNFGHLPFIKSQKIPYSIQNYIFTAPKGHFSQPLRTVYGYYLVRLVDMRDQQGFVKVAHIMQGTTGNLSDSVLQTKKQRADSIYQEIKKGKKFEDFVKLSDDKGSAKKGGELPEFSTGRMVPNFEKAAFALQKPGDISKPIKTRFGWHIIKLISKRPPEEAKKGDEKVRKMVEKDKERKEIVRKFVTKQLKSDFNYKQINSPELLLGILDSTIFKGKWKVPNAKTLNTPLFSLSNKKYTDADFAAYIQKKQKRQKKGDIKALLNTLFEDFVYETLSETEINNLEKNKKEFSYLLKEYHDGMLLFDLMKKEVWDKASNDSVGLKNFYDTNYDKLYSKQINYDISVFEYKHKKDAKKAMKLLTKARAKYNDKLLVKKISKGDTARFAKLASGSFAKGENIYADKIFNKNNADNKKVFDFPSEKTIIVVNKKETSKAKPFEEIRGLVISDYQNALEKEWLKELKSKYPVKINSEELQKIKKAIK